VDARAAGQRIARALPRYGSIAVAFHWVVAALVVFLGTLGLLFDDIPQELRPILNQLSMAKEVWR